MVIEKVTPDSSLSRTGVQTDALPSTIVQIEQKNTIEPNVEKLSISVPPSQRIEKSSVLNRAESSSPGRSTTTQIINLKENPTIKGKNSKFASAIERFSLQYVYSAMFSSFGDKLKNLPERTLHLDKLSKSSKRGIHPKSLFFTAWQLYMSCKYLSILIFTMYKY
jgi:hypothetical protein